MRAREQPGGGIVRIAAVAFVLVSAMSSTSHAEVRPGEVVRDVHRRGNYPSDLAVMPGEPITMSEGGGADGEGPVRPRTPVRLYRSGGENTPQRAPDPDFPLPALGALGEILGWLLVGVCVLALLGALVYGLAQLRFRSSPPDAAVSPKAADGAGEAALDPLLVMPELSAEELARLGRYREAIHALFVASLLATGFRPEGKARGATAREIVQAMLSVDTRKPPLASLLTETELVWFGGRPATLETFERARAMHADVLRGARP